MKLFPASILENGPTEAAFVLLMLASAFEVPTATKPPVPLRALPPVFATEFVVMETSFVATTSAALR